MSWLIIREKTVYFPEAQNIKLVVELNLRGKNTKNLKKVVHKLRRIFHNSAIEHPCPLTSPLSMEEKVLFSFPHDAPNTVQRVLSQGPNLCELCKLLQACKF